MKTEFFAFKYCPKCGLQDNCKSMGHGYTYDETLFGNSGSHPQILTAHIVNYCCSCEFVLNHPNEDDFHSKFKPEFCSDCIKIFFED